MTPRDFFTSSQSLKKKDPLWLSITCLQLGWWAIQMMFDFPSPPSPQKKHRVSPSLCIPNFWFETRVHSHWSGPCVERGVSFNKKVESTGSQREYPSDPWDCYIYLHENHKNQPNVRIYNIYHIWILWDTLFFPLDIQITCDISGIQKLGWKGMPGVIPPRDDMLRFS